MKDDKAIFKQLRELPPELNIGQVKNMVAAFPATVPVPSHWLSKITFKNIVMIALPTTVVVSTLMFLLPLNEPKEIPALAEMPVSIEESMEDSLVFPISNTAKQKAEPIQIIPHKKAKNTTPTPQVKFKIDTLKKLERIHPILKKQMDSMLIMDIEPIKPRIIQKMDIKPIAEPLKLNDCQAFQGNISRFRMDLKTYLSKDGLYKLKDGKLRISYYNSKIVINRGLIPEKLQEKYATLFAKYNIIPCPIFIIEITKKYIAAGKITPNGFKGRVEGGINLDDLNKIKIEDLQPIGAIRAERDVDDFHSLVLKGKVEVHVKDGEEPRVWLESSAIEEEAVFTIVEESILTIDAMDLGHGQHSTIRVFVEAPEYRSILALEEATVASNRPIMAEDLAITVNDKAVANLEIDADKVIIDVISGKLVVFGRVGEQTITGRTPLHQGAFDNSQLKVRGY